MMLGSSTDEPSKSLLFLISRVGDKIVVAVNNHNNEFRAYYEEHPERYLLDLERRWIGYRSREIFHSQLHTSFKEMEKDKDVVFRNDSGIFMMQFFRTYLMDLKSVKLDLKADIPKAFSRSYTYPLPFKEPLPDKLPIPYLQHVIGKLVRGEDMSIAAFYIEELTRDTAGAIQSTPIRLDLVKKPMILTTESKTKITKKAGNG